MTVADELSRRLELWEQISAGDAANAEPTALRSMRVYGGAQGIWVDKMTTASLSPDDKGLRSVSCTQGGTTLTTYPTMG
jgi:hypothetical protein